MYVNIQLPSAFPPPCPHKVIGSSMFFWNLCVIRFFCFCCSGHRFYTLVSFWCPWGSFGEPGAPRAFLKGQRRKSDEKVGSLAASWPPLGVPLGSNFLYFSAFFSMFFLAIFSKRFLEGFWSLRGFPPTMKMMVSFRRNHYFRISPSLLKLPEFASNGYPLGSLWVVFGGVGSYFGE